MRSDDLIFDQERIVAKFGVDDGGCTSIDRGRKSARDGQLVRDRHQPITVDTEHEALCRDPGEYSNTLTAVVVPTGIDSDEVLSVAEADFGLSLGTGLGRLKGRAFRIGHLGWVDESDIDGVLASLARALPVSRRELATAGGGNSD